MTKEVSQADWLAEGEKLFGTDPRKWKFKCPNCGHVQSMEDFIELRNEKILAPNFDVGSVVNSFKDVLEYLGKYFFLENGF